MDATCMYGHTYSKSMDQPDKVASPARGQLDRKNEYFPVRVQQYFGEIKNEVFFKERAFL